MLHKYYNLVKRGYLEMDNVFNNCSIEITNNKIFGYFELSSIYVSFSAEYKSSIIHQKSSFYTYEGEAIIGSDEATISIVMNKDFITGVIEGKELPLYFLVTKTNIPQAQLSEVFQIYNQELKNKNLSLDDLVMVEISEEKEIQTIGNKECEGLHIQGNKVRFNISFYCLTSL